MRRTLIILAATATFLVPSLASAKPKKSTRVSAEDTDKGYAYKFGDDLVDGGGLSGQTAQIKVRPRHVRRTLIRPRLHFVPELLKSVEHI